MIGSMPTIEKDLDELDKHIQEYRVLLNTEGMWLFLATLGCWSVSYPPLQLIAFAIAALLFADRFSNRLDEKRSFKQLIEIIESRISEYEGEEDSKKTRLYELSQINDEQLSIRKGLKKSNIFLLCWLNFTLGLTYAYIQFGLQIFS